MKLKLGLIAATVLSACAVSVSYAGPAEKAVEAPPGVKCPCWKEHVGPDCNTDQGLTPETRRRWMVCVRERSKAKRK